MRCAIKPELGRLLHLNTSLRRIQSMKMKFCSLLASAALLALASTANAAEPVALSDNQMDSVTAGAAATANAAALALGDFLTFTTTQTSTDAVTSIGSIPQVA